MNCNHGSTFLRKQCSNNYPCRIGKCTGHSKCKTGVYWLSERKCCRKPYTLQDKRQPIPLEQDPFMLSDDGEFYPRQSDHTASIRYASTLSDIQRKLNTGMKLVHEANQDLHRIIKLMEDEIMNK